MCWVASQAGVHTLVLPAAHETVETWKSGFNFVDMPEDDVRCHYNKALMGSLSGAVGFALPFPALPSASAPPGWPSSNCICALISPCMPQPLATIHAHPPIPVLSRRLAKQQLRILIFPGTEVLWKHFEGVKPPEGHHVLVGAF